MLLKELQMLPDFKSYMTINAPSSKNRAGEVEVDTNMLYESVESRLYGSTIYSTSGRRTDGIGAIIGVYTRQLMLRLEEIRKRSCKDLFYELEQQAVMKLRDKDIEIERARLFNSELKETLRQVVAESQLWFNVVRDNETLVCSLGAMLEQGMQAAASGSREGHDDNDAESCCYGEQAVIRPGRCKSCGEREVSVVVLPCRHLCLCEDCESRTETCPVCQSAKHSSLPIDMLGC